MNISELIAKILLHINDLWQVDNTEIKKNRVLLYQQTFVDNEQGRYPIYDYCPVRIFVTWICGNTSRI